MDPHVVLDTQGNLRQWVGARLEGADSDAAALVLATFDGPEAVRRVLAGETSPAPPQTTGSALDPVWLKHLVVEGFRGIGRQTRLELQPSPGLTVINGRNGSGKSSLAEALEVALTGRTHRWGDEKFSTQFDPEWRNLHTDSEPAIALRLTRPGSSEITLDVAWAKGETDKNRSILTLRQGDRTGEVTDLGWESALQVFRPLLSYEELGQSLLKANQQATAQAFERGLGLQQLTAASDALKQVIKESKGAAEAEKSARARLRPALEASCDDRAAELVTKLPKRITPTVDTSDFAAAAVVSGQHPPTELLHRIAALELPEAETIDQAADRLEQAWARRRELQGGTQELDNRRHQLLTLALELQEATGDCPCPVCGGSTLDSSWREQTRATLRETSQHAQALAGADQELAQAWSQVRRLVTAPRELFQQLVELDSQEAAARAWQSWAELPESPEDAAARLREAYAQVRAATAAWQQQASDQAAQLREDWSPIAEKLLGWVTAYRAYCDEHARDARLKAADELMKSVVDQARQHQLEPIRRQAQQMWEMLRHESNVSLGELRLTSRRLDIPAEIDGTSTGGALKVMSQGELHALALALFLPRVTSELSPFRFVVLDDPVQAMDPSKVEGLLDVLLSLAKSRQVVVFSHDDRLAAAARRRMLSSQATIRLLQVERRPGSVVTVRPAADPAHNYLVETAALLKDPSLNDAVRTRVAGGLLRMALEAAARDLWFAAALQLGWSLEAAESKWADERTTRRRLQLALNDDPDHWSREARHRGSALWAANSGNHEPLPVHRLEGVLHDTRQTVKDLQAGR